MLANEKAPVHGLFLLVPEKGIEPPRCCHRQILSLLRLPFRHSGMDGQKEGCSYITGVWLVQPDFFSLGESRIRSVHTGWKPVPR